MNGKKHNFCLIGAGRMGRRWAKIIAGQPENILKTVVDKDEAAASLVAKENGADYSLDAAVALSDPEISAVLIATPHKYLFDFARRALLLGKNVLVEKPGSRTPQEMQELVEVAKEKKLVLMVGYNYRFFDAIRRAKEIVSSGKIGKINFIRLRHGHPGRSGYNQEWRMSNDLAGGGVMMDQGVHLIDLVNWFLPARPETVKCATNNLFWKSDAEENAFLILKNAENQIASLHVSVTQWKPIFSLEIYGEHGFCSIEGLGKKYGGEEILNFGQYLNGELKEERVVCNPDADNSLRLELGEFVSAVKEGRNSVPGGEDGLKALEIAEAAYGNL